MNPENNFDSRVQIGATAGGFDPFHEYHYDHLVQCMKYCRSLLIFVSRDIDIVAKRTTADRAGWCNSPLEWRIKLLNYFCRGANIPAMSIPTIDVDGTQAKTLEYYRPKVFLKGGDRTPDTMPQNEIDICEKLNIKIIYGVGGQGKHSREFRY